MIDYPSTYDLTGIINYVELITSEITTSLENMDEVDSIF